jgi:hypothetical protein
MFESCKGTLENPVEAYGNYVEVFNGPDGENEFGVVRVMRVRSIDNPNYTEHVYIHDNTFIGIVDTVAATTAIGKDVSTLQLSMFDWGGADQDNNIRYENNTVIARALTEGANAKALEVAIRSEVTSPILTIKNNHYKSSNVIVRLADEFNGISSFGYTLDGDTLAFLDTEIDSGLVYDAETFFIGYSGVTSSDLAAKNCVYLEGASDDDINFAPGTQEIEIIRSLRFYSYGNNDLPIAGAECSVWNSYGLLVFFGTSDVNGLVGGDVIYRYESNADDSTAYNPFTIHSTFDEELVINNAFTVTSVPSGATDTLVFSVAAEDIRISTSITGKVNMSGLLEIN